MEDKLKDLDEALVFFLENNYIENTESLKVLIPREIEFEDEFLKSLNIKIETAKIGDKSEMLTLAYKNAFEFAYKRHLESLSVK
jgi:excinuclease UvrABC nuclease subunit